MSDVVQDCQTQAVPVQPVASLFSVAKMQSPDGQSAVMLQVSTPVGVAVYFLDPEAARKVGRDLIANAKAGPSLVLPDSRLVVAR